MKKWLARFGIFSTVALGGTLSVEGNRIMLEQETIKIIDGKYRQYKQDEYRPGLRIDEYVAPEGIGYQVIEYEDRADGKWVRAYGSGVQDKERTFDWRPVEPPKVATST